MKRRALLIVAIVGMLFASSLGAISGQAKAVADQAKTQSSVSPAAPAFEVCTYQGSSSLCLNRYQGGTDAGTNVIGYNAGSDDNGFIIVSISDMCRSGHVSDAIDCPFTLGRGLNVRYNGDSIVEIQTLGLSSPLCVGDSGSTSGSAALGLCPDNDGNGGSNGTIFVLSESDPSFVVNRYWSDATNGGNGYNPQWMCIYGLREPVFLNGPTGEGGYCQFEELTG
jgi:hypothetical protein